MLLALDDNRIAVAAVDQLEDIAMAVHLVLAHLVFVVMLTVAAQMVDQLQPLMVVAAAVGCVDCTVHLAAHHHMDTDLVHQIVDFAVDLVEMVILVDLVGHMAVVVRQDIVVSHQVKICRMHLVVVDMQPTWVHLDQLLLIVVVVVVVAVVIAAVAAVAVDMH